MMICPTCHNDPAQLVVTALVNRAGQCSLEPHPCPTCDGTGSITSDQFERMAAGDVVRRRRVAFGLTIWELASVSGVTPRDVADYERGRLPDGHDPVRDKIYAGLAWAASRQPAGVSG